jgi:hypothetical protein
MCKRVSSTQANGPFAGRDHVEQRGKKISSDENVTERKYIF